MTAMWVLVPCALFSAAWLAWDDRREGRPIHWTSVAELVVIAIICAGVALAGS